MPLVAPVSIQHRYGCFYILATLPDVVSAANFTGVGTLSGRTLSGTAYTVPTADFQSTVTAGGEQYVVSFKVTESPTGGNAVHSVDVVRVLKPEFNAQYDRNVTANGNGVPTGTSPSLESGGGEGYNGRSNVSADGSNGTDPEGGLTPEGAGKNFSIGNFDDLPSSAQNSYKGYEGNGWKGNYSGQTPGTNAGRAWNNELGDLPTLDRSGNQITYREFDVNNRISGSSRDSERFLVGSDGSIYYTPDHYGTFIRIQ